jgi:hypothetical protein
MNLWVQEVSAASEAESQADGMPFHMSLVQDLRVTQRAFVNRQGAKAAFQMKEEGWTECADMAVAQKIIFSLGWGPCPFYRRPGVAVAIPVNDEGQHMIGCIIPHVDGNYLSVSEANYVVYVGRGTANSQGRDTLLIHPIEMCDLVLVVATKLLVDCKLPYIQQIFGDRMGPRSNELNSGEDVGEQQADVEGVQDTLMVRLDVPSQISPPEKLLYVTVEVRHRGNIAAPYPCSFYIEPQHLRMPCNEADMRTCRKFVYTSANV